MKTNPKKPRLLLNFILSLLIIVIAFSIDRSYEHRKAQQRKDAPAAEPQAADTASYKPESKAGQHTVDTTSDTAALKRREK